jgi:hypothetical protein
LELVPLSALVLVVLALRWEVALLLVPLWLVVLRDLQVLWAGWVVQVLWLPVRLVLWLRL